MMKPNPLPWHSSNFPCVARAAAILFALGSAVAPALAADGEWTPLLDPELSQWEIFMGVPHATVQGIPNVPPDSNGMRGTPLGLNNDPKKVYSVIEQDGEPVLKITGEIYGGLTSLKEYSDYHIRMQVKWGEKKWEPRLDKPKDSGLLYHCVGDHGAMWNVWMTSVECQIQENDIGDFFPIAGGSAMIPAVEEAPKRWVCKPGAEPQAFGNRPNKAGGRCIRTENHEVPGDWNTVEVYTVGDRALHLVNGRVVNILLDIASPGPEEGTIQRLDRGKLQIQSEGAEVYYRRIEIRPITEFPPDLLDQAGLK